MTRLLFSSGMLALSLAGCGGLRSLAAPDAASPLSAQHSKGSASSTCLSVTCIYVVEGGSGRGSPTVLVYPADATGNVSPVAVIDGKKAGISAGQAIAVDGTRKIYVASGFEYGSQSLVVYAAGANGNAPPLRTIAGPDTGLDTPDGVAVGADGVVYVANNSSSGEGFGSVTEYAVGVDGDAAPLRTIAGYQTGVIAPTGLALDSTGLLYVLNKTSEIGDEGPSITVFRHGAKGDAKPVRTITGSATELASVTGIAVDGAGKIYVSEFDGVYGSGSASVLVFAAGAHGDAAPVGIIGGTNAKLFATDGVGVDSTGNVYVSNLGGGRGNGGSVSVYASGAYGDQAPIQDIAGPVTKLRNDYGLAIR
jgi:hypothetical protein